MKKNIVVSTAILLICFKSNSQITKGNWLVGGNASFSSLQTSSDATAKYKQTSFQISPNIGYFIKDKFVVGLRPSFQYGKNSVVASNAPSKIFNVGPFTRYYFLQTERVFNILVEGSYQYGTINAEHSSQKSNSFSFLIAPVLYFNSSVGLEFPISYSTTKVVSFAGRNNELRFGIGFQFHLEPVN